MKNNTIYSFIKKKWNIINRSGYISKSNSILRDWSGEARKKKAFHILFIRGSIFSFNLFLYTRIKLFCVLRRVSFIVRAKYLRINSHIVIFLRQVLPQTAHISSMVIWGFFYTPFYTWELDRQRQARRSNECPH
jgi:hypothetical protein